LSDAASVGDERALDAEAPDDPAWTAHLRRQQLTLLARQWTRSPYAISVACCFVAYTVRDHEPLLIVAGWAAVLIGLLFARRPYAQKLLREPPEDPQRALQRLVWFSAAHGALIGAGAVLFFPNLPVEQRALLTMILVCWCAGGVSTAAAYARAFYYFVAPALLPLALMWILTLESENIVIGVLVVLFGLFQVFFVRDNERLVHESFLIRYENERLLDALERERQEVLLARDRAEEASRAKSRFLAAASHDLRQPLHAIALYSGALSLRATEPAIAEIAERIDTTVTSLSALFDSMLDISRLDAGAIRPELQRVDLKRLVQRIGADYEAITHAKGLDFRVVGAEALVETDPLLLERIVRNLLDNAVKYTKTGRIDLSMQASGDAARIAVTDTGPGIAAAERERIFEEFYQIGNPERDRLQGLGLGLAIVRRLVHLLGLRIELQSEPGSGSTFAVALARIAGAHAETRAPGAAAASAAQTLGGVHVLVLDDEPAVRMGMRALLESWGCHVAACAGHAEADRLLDEYGLAVDLIVADFRLRQHENGIDTVQRLRERLGPVPALLVSGDTAPERLRQAQASGIPLLHKPVSSDKLKQEMTALLHSAGAAKNTRGEYSDDIPA
jgi:signal transduction histidine kinase/ActR/RegA family two-component response regulator